MKRTKAPYLYFAGVILFLLPFEASLFRARPALAQKQKAAVPRKESRPVSPAQSRSDESDIAPRSDVRRNVDEERKDPTGAAMLTDKAQVTGLRFLSWNGYTRIMLDLSQETKYEVRRLKEDPAKGMPPRIYVDVMGARLALLSKEPVPVEDGLLRQVRLGQYSADIVRVVLDMNSLRDHKTFLLADPYRLVIDVYGQRVEESAAVKEVARTPTTDGHRAVAKVNIPSSPAPATSGLRKIVLDPGHGGKDPGAIGAGGITEKDIVLSIAKKLATKLRNEMRVDVVLTRKDDRFVELEDRTKLANKENADLFISLHMNASENAEAKGIETYYLDNTTDEAAIRLAARENSTSRKSISDLQFILSDMTQNMKLEDSITLAHRLQGSLVGGMAKTMDDVRDLGVKKALFHVLVGARMPSVLVEMFFISNRSEGRAMSRESYQDAMVEALFEGIQKYGQSNLVARTL
ncbi:MAG TPA: N-acetylmuramoyl-L-alanine amidase [Candidatus Binatia bacterium]